MTLSEVFELYCRDVIVFRNQSRKTEEHHYVTLKSLVGYLGDIPIEELTFENVREWKLDMEKRGLSEETVRGYLVKLRVVLGYLKLNGYECLDPSNIPLPHRSARIPDVLTPKEVTKLIASTRKDRNKAIISLLYSTGLRVNELCQLNRKDIENDYFPIVGKGGKSRLCFIDERSRGLLTRYLASRVDNDPSLFLSPLNGRRITPGTVQEIFKVARVKAGFDWPVHPHTLRHSFATNLMKNGAHLRAIQLMMGHASLDTTQQYLRLFDQDLIDSYKKYHSV